MEIFPVREVIVEGLKNAAPYATAAILGGGVVAMSFRASSQGTESREVGNLKLQAQKITDFSGAHSE